MFRLWNPGWRHFQVMPNCAYSLRFQIHEFSLLDRCRSKYLWQNESRLTLFYTHHGLRFLNCTQQSFRFFKGSLHYRTLDITTPVKGTIPFVYQQVLILFQGGNDVILLFLLHICVFAYPQILHKIISDYSGSWFPIKHGIFVCYDMPWTDAPRMKVEKNDAVYVTKWRR